MTWTVTWTQTSNKYYSRMSRTDQERVQAAIAEMAKDPHSAPHVKRLRGELEGLCRCRVGKVRVVFRILDSAKEVRILAIASRGNVYK